MTQIRYSAIFILMVLILVLNTVSVLAARDEMYIIGYDIKPGSPEEAKLNELASQHSGSYLSAADPSTPQNLESSLNIAFHGGPTPGITQIPLGTSPPEYLSECEQNSDNICGEFFLTGDQYEAYWDDGTTAVLTIEKWDSNGVVLNLVDTGDYEGGYTGRYTGQIAGKSIENGKVVWTYDGWTKSGTWTASWDDTVVDDSWWDDTLWDEYLE